MPWVRRISTVAFTLGTALVVYAAYVILILRQINRMIFGCPVMTGGASSTGALGVHAHGFFIPLWWIIVLWILLPLTWASLEFCHWIQQLNRERLGLCVECGGRLVSAWRGKCPRCGVRIGPD